LSKSGTQSYTVVIKDSRNRTKTLTGSYEVMAYKSPTVNIASVFRFLLRFFKQSLLQ
jgi:hypothetical protein